MKIKTTQTKERELDIETPFFRQDATSPCLKLMAVLNESTVVSIFEGSGRTSVSVDPVKDSVRDIGVAYQEWLPITEQEFLAHHSNALASLSLEPKLVDDIPSKLFTGRAE